MLRLTQVTQYIFCLVSMILTSLFAISLSGVSIGEMDSGVSLVENIFSVSLFVLIGCCIDFGKYLFWAQRGRSHYYGVIAVILTGFSLLASCAFFISAEFSALNKSRLMTVEYKALQQKIDSVNKEIGYQERLLEKRLDSQYHQQWIEGEKNSQKIGELKNTLVNLIETSKEVGRESAISQVPITKIFEILGQVMNVSAEVIRNTGYGLLALLLEVSTLGAISLSRSLQQDGELSDQSHNAPKSELLDEDLGLREKIQKLTRDIVKGEVRPVVRKIKAAQYGLNIDEIRQVLRNLYLAGLIEKDLRNSYKLCEKNSREPL